MKNKLLSVISIALLILIIGTITVSAADNEYLGDVDGNGKISAADARIILRYSANLDNINDDYIHLADVNGDEEVTAADARLVLRMSASLDSLFMYGEKYHLHEYKTVVLKEATCSEVGEKNDVCTICGKTSDNVIVEKTPHPFVETIVKNASCNSAGEKKLVCSDCGYSTTETIEKLAHSYLDATCTKPKTCKVCGKTEGDKKEHNYVTTSCFSPATCKNCGTTSGEASGHTFSGLKCTKCGKQYDTMENYAINCIRNDLMKRLKNPNSLMIFDMYYTIPNKEQCVFVIWIDISAMNSYGGYTRETVKYGIDANGNAHYDRVYLWDTTHHSMNTNYVKNQLGLS